jgi:hypothetical protein
MVKQVSLTTLQVVRKFNNNKNRYFFSIPRSFDISCGSVYSIIHDTIIPRSLCRRAYHRLTAEWNTRSLTNKPIYLLMTFGSLWNYVRTVWASKQPKLTCGIMFLKPFLFQHRHRHHHYLSRVRP